MNVLFEDNYIVVIDKPAGIVVNKSETTKGQQTVQDWASFFVIPSEVSPKTDESRDPLTTKEDFRLKSKDLGDNNEKYDVNQEFYSRGGVVHRLDKETSGVLIIAKTPESFSKIKEQFMNRQVKKTYLALAHGKLVPETGTISVPVGRLPYNRMRFGVLPGGRESVTDYRVISNFKFKISNNYEDFTLVELYPKTGRTHQLRIHLLYLRHPIFADELYAGRKTARSDRKFLPRIFLHAHKLNFYHPVTNEEINIISELPKELNDFLGTLSKI